MCHRYVERSILPYCNVLIYALIHVVYVDLNMNPSFRSVFSWLRIITMKFIVGNIFLRGNKVTPTWYFDQCKIGSKVLV